MKFKPFIKRLFPVLVCLALLSGLFVMPVSAASAGWFEYGVTMDDIYDGGAVDTTTLQGYIDAPNVTQWESSTVLNQYLYGDGGGGSLPITGVRYRLRTGTYLTEWGFGEYGDTFTAGIPFPVFYSPLVSAGSVFSISADTILIGLAPVYGDVTAVRLGISQVDANYQHIKSYSYTLGLVKENNGNYHYYDNLFSIKTVNTDSYFCISYVEVDFTLVGTGQTSLSLTIPEGFSFSFGNPNSPEAPSFSAPDDGGTLDDLESGEAELEQNTAVGKEETNNIFSSFADQLLSFAGGIIAASAIMELFINIPAIGGLIFISLALGLVSFIFNLGHIDLPHRDGGGKSMMNADGTRARDPDWDEKWLM